MAEVEEHERIRGEVARGEEAALPGRWVCVVDDESDLHWGDVREGFDGRLSGWWGVEDFQLGGREVFREGGCGEVGDWRGGGPVCRQG